MGFALRDLDEPRPTDQAIRARPELADAAMVPYFVVLDLQKPWGRSAPGPVADNGTEKG